MSKSQTHDGRELQEKPRVSAVIVNYESGALLSDCIASIGVLGVETIVVDNGSADGSSAAAAVAFRQIKVVTPDRNGFAEGANLGAREARGELLLFLNPDIKLGPGSLNTLADAYTDERIGVVGPPLEIAAAETVSSRG